jgi:RNA polymerase sigma-70 factor (ECF subfamily)
MPGERALIGNGADAGRARRLASIFADESSFRAFYDRALPRVFGYLVNRVGSRDVAEELTQQAFLEATRTRETYDGRSDPVVWLVGIARHKLADHFRLRDREERRHFRLVVREIDAAQRADDWRSSDERDAILSALRQLPALQRAALVLRYADGLPVREVAERIGRSEGATESLLARARESFRRSYGEGTDG